MNSPKEIAQNYVNVGAGKCALSVWRMLLLGVLAGAFIGFAGVCSQATAATIASPSVAKFVGALVFPAGLAMVILAGSELFTGNCLLVVPLLAGKVSAASVLRNWVFVYIGNLIGGLLVALLCTGGRIFSLYGGAMGELIMSTAAAKVSLGFGEALCRGVLCNILVCIAVWMAMAAKDAAGKILALYFPVMLFVACGFEHSVANMYYISAGLFGKLAGLEAASVLTWGAFFVKNLLPVTLGNLVGGAAVGAAYWAVYLKGEKA